MRIVKRSLSVLLSVLILISVLSIAPAYAAENDLSIEGSTYSGTTGDCTWELNTTSGVLTISGNGEMESYFEDTAPWVLNDESINTVIINEGVTYVGDYSFEDCEELTSVTLPTTVKGIGGSAFYNCINLSNINIPNSVETIGESAFESCSTLASINIPESVTTIDDSAFCDCTSLKSVIIPNSITVISDEVFSYCENLKEVTIPNSVTTIEDSAFWECASLKNIYYNGTKSDWEKIKIYDDNEDLAKATIHCENGSFVIKHSQSIKAKSYTKTFDSRAFNLKAEAKTKLSYKTSNKKVVTVSSKGKVTIKGCGKATITINAAATSTYKSATKKITITVKPGKLKITTFKGNRNLLRIYFKKQKNVNSYKMEIPRFSIKKNIKTKKNYIIIKKLPKGKCTVKIRAYKKINGKKVYGKYGKVQFL